MKVTLGEVNQETFTALGEATVVTRHFRTLVPTTPLSAGSPHSGAGRRPQPLTTTGTASPSIAELTANAALHGRVQGRDARLALTLTPTTLRIEVTDARGGRLPVRTPDADTDGESGRGLLLVTTLADAWGCDPPPGRQDGVGGVHPERLRGRARQEEKAARAFLARRGRERTLLGRILTAFQALQAGRRGTGGSGGCCIDDAA